MDRSHIKLQVKSINEFAAYHRVDLRAISPYIGAKYTRVHIESEALKGVLAYFVIHTMKWVPCYPRVDDYGRRLSIPSAYTNTDVESWKMAILAALRPDVYFPSNDDIDRKKAIDINAQLNRDPLRVAAMVSILEREV